MHEFRFQACPQMAWSCLRGWVLVLRSISGCVPCTSRFCGYLDGLWHAHQLCREGRNLPGPPWVLDRDAANVIWAEPPLRRGTACALSRVS